MEKEGKEKRREREGIELEGILGKEAEILKNKRRCFTCYQEGKKGKK